MKTNANARIGGRWRVAVVRRLVWPSCPGHIPPLARLSCHQLCGLCIRVHRCLLVRYSNIAQPNISPHSCLFCAQPATHFFLFLSANSPPTLKATPSRLISTSSSPSSSTPSTPTRRFSSEVSFVFVPEEYFVLDILCPYVCLPCALAHNLLFSQSLQH